MSSESELSESSESETEVIINKKKTEKVVSKDSSGSKLTTKEMVTQALTDRSHKKGTSMYAIKKFLQENYNVNLEKMGPYIKKYVKNSVQDGSIIQTKGIGATGSFKLNLRKDQKKVESENKKGEPKKTKKKSDKPEKVDKTAVNKKKTVKIPISPKKRALIMKRKSIGSIRKPPKMKPAKAK